MESLGWCSEGEVMLMAKNATAGCWNFQFQGFEFHVLLAQLERSSLWSTICEGFTY